MEVTGPRGICGTADEKQSQSISFAALPFPTVMKRYPYTAGLTEFPSHWMTKPVCDLGTFQQLSAPKPSVSNHLSMVSLKYKDWVVIIVSFIVLRPGRVAQLVGHLTHKSGVLGSIPCLATYFRFSFRFFKKGSCQLLAKVSAQSTG